MRSLLTLNVKAWIFPIMDIDINLRNDKTGLLAYFRSRANEIVSELALLYSAADYKKKASALNKAIIQSKENLLSIVEETAKKPALDKLRDS